MKLCVNSIRLFVRCVCQGRPSYWWTKRVASQYILGGGGGKHPVSTIKYVKFDQLITRKIIKLIATNVTFQAIMQQIRFRLSHCSFVS